MTKDSFELVGRVEAVLIAPQFDSLESRAVEKIQLIRGYGVKHDRHAGPRLADVREDDLLGFGLLKGIEVANFREFSAVSVEEVSAIANILGLAEIPYGCLGENLVLSALPRLTELPTGTMLCFKKGDRLRSAVLVVWGENTPCIFPGKIIQQRLPASSEIARGFAKAAMGRRGIVGSIYSSGFIARGDSVVVKVPSQRIYDPTR